MLALERSWSAPNSSRQAWPRCQSDARRLHVGTGTRSESDPTVSRTTSGCIGAATVARTEKCHRLSRWDGTQRWDLASAGTSQYPLIRWAQHTNSHRLVGRSLRLWAPATASKPTTLACRVAKTRRVHKASGDRGDSPGADVPFISALFSPDQFRAFVKRYGPVALGKIHVAVCRGTPVHLTYCWLFARHSGGDRCSCVRWILPLCADGAVDPASAYAGRDDAPIIPAFVVQHRFVPG